MVGPRGRPVRTRAGLLLFALALVAVVPSPAPAANGILSINVVATPNPFSPNGDGRREALNLTAVFLIDPTVSNPQSVEARVAFTLGGTEVRVFEGTAPVNGQTATFSVTWDGKDAAGNPAPEGTYGWTVTGTLVTAPAVGRRGLADHLVVSEVMVDPSGTQSAGEFVEIYNPTGAPVDVSGWAIVYKTATGTTWSAVAPIPSGKTVPAFGYLLVGGNGVVPAPDVVDLTLGFAATGGHVGLRDSAGRIVDRVGYGNAVDPEGAAVAAPPKNATLERRPGASQPGKGNGWDSDDNSNDFDVRLAAEPQNSASATEIPDYVLGRLTVSAPSLAAINDAVDVTLDDVDRNNKTAISETVTVRVTSGADPAGFLFTLKESGVDAGVFTASANGLLLGAKFGATDAAAGKIGVSSAGDVVTVAYQDPAPYQSMTATVSTPIGPPPARVTINEVVYDPVGTDGGKEWVELYNAGGSAADLSGWTLTDEDAATPATIPAGVTLPSGAFLVLRLGATGTNDLDFSDGTGTLFLSTTISLANTNDQVTLYNSPARDEASLVDFMQYSTTSSVTEPADAQKAVNRGQWPTTTSIVPTSGAPEGASLRRLPDGADSNVPTDWSIDVSPTQGVSNAFVAPPTAPGNLVAAVTGTASVRLDWTGAVQGSDPLGGYWIFRRLTAEGFGAPIAVLGPTTLTYVDSAVEPGRTYVYAVGSFDANGVAGALSNEAEASVPVLAARVVVNEIMFDPTGPEPANEWIELFNPLDRSADLSNWTVTDGEGSFRIPVGVTIPANGFLVLGYSPTAAGGNVDLAYGGQAGISLANSGDDVFLSDDAGVVIDSVTYAASWAGEAGQAANANLSLERKSPTLYGQDRRSWGHSAVVGGTPGAPNSVDTVPPRLVHEPRPAALAGHDVAVHAFVSDAQSPTILSHTTLFWRSAGAAAFQSVPMTKLQEPHDAVILRGDLSGASAVEYYIVAEDDANNETFSPAVADPASAPFSVPIIADDRPRVRISEIMYDPGSLPEPEGEWVELTNVGSTPADISGWVFTDSQGPAISEGLFVIPAGTVIPPGGFLVLAHSASAAGGRADILYGASQTGSFQLTNSFAEISDQVTLLDPSGVVVDEANYSSKWGANNGTDPADRTLERVDYLASPNLEETWRVSAQEGGTPGEPNGGGFARVLSITPSQINPFLGENAAIEIRLSRAATVTLDIEDTAGGLVRRILDAAPHGADTFAVAWDGRDMTGRVAWGVGRVVLTAADADGNVSVDKLDDREGLVLDEDWSVPSDYNPYRNGTATHTFLVTKPLDLTIRFEDDTGVARRILHSGFIGDGPHGIKWDGRDDSGVILREHLSLKQSIRTIEGRLIIVDERPAVDGDVESLAFAGRLGETARIDARSSVPGALDAWVQDGLGAVVRRLVPGSAVDGNQTFSVAWDGRDDMGDSVAENVAGPTSFYTIALRVTSSATGRPGIRFLNVRNRSPGVIYLDEATGTTNVYVNDGDGISAFQDDAPVPFGPAVPIGGGTVYQVLLDTSPRGTTRIRVDVTPRSGGSFSEEREIGLNQATLAVAPASFNPSAGETTAIRVTLAAADAVSAVASRFFPSVGAYIPIRVVFSGVLTAGENVIVWNGMNPGGAPEVPGTYRLTVGHAYAPPYDALTVLLPYAVADVEVRAP